MRVTVKTRVGFQFWVGLPTALLTNRCVIRLLPRFVKDTPLSGVDREDLRKLLRVLALYRRAHPRLELIRVETAAGESVSVRL